MTPTKIVLSRDKLAQLIDFIREAPNAPPELYDASVAWEIEAFGVEDMEPSG